MDKLLIRGGRSLRGEVLISGAKNAALPELCASLLTAEPVALRNVPRLQDVVTMQRLIRNMGVQVERGDDGAVSQLEAVLQHARPRVDEQRAAAVVVTGLELREHVLAHADDLAALIGTCPGLTLLVTSRFWRSSSLP